MPGYVLPTQRSYEETLKFLTWEQFPAILESSVRYFSVLPQVGIYRHVNANIKPFMQALHDTTSRDFTMSGIGSLFDFEQFGHQIKRPTPQLAGTGCNGNSLCLEPKCFGFVEGLVESNNMIQDMCWSLNMPCLKDVFYSDREFDRKMKAYFAMFFKQGPAVLEAYQRTRLIQESIKVVATDKNFLYTGSVIGGSSGISLPFYISPTDPLAFPDTDDIGANIGGANLKAFINYMAPRLFAGSFGDGMEGLRVYGMKQDYMVAKEQTASVVDHYMDQEMLRALRMRGISDSEDQIDGLIGTFIHDGMFPTFKLDADNVITPITQEILEPATIAGYMQTQNPEHSLAKYRALLFVPGNWRFDLVEPPRDDFSDLGLGAGLNFRSNSPGVFPVLSSSIFSQNTIGGDGTVILGQNVGNDGQVVTGFRGLQSRSQPIAEAIRTEVLMTYSNAQCGNTTPGQLENVGRPIDVQSRADGFRLKSTMYIGSDVRGTAKPVLLIFQTDNPRSAQPIKVCSVVEVDVDDTIVDLSLVSCSPGDQTYAVLTFNRDVEDDFTVDDLAVYRTGGRGDTYLVEVTAVSGKVVTISSVDSDGEAAETTIPCCSSSPDDYGTRGELLVSTGATTKTGEIMKATYDEDSDTIFIEYFKPTASALINADGTLTLENGDVIQVRVAAAKPVGVFAQIEADSGETCDLSTLDCSCLVNAVIVMD